MKVLFVFQGLPHYYNYVLNKFNQVEGLEVVNVVPRQRLNVGAGVYQTSANVQFKLVELEEYQPRYGGFFLRGLADLIRHERPDVIVANHAYIRGFFCNLPVRMTLWRLGVRLIMKSIPFELPDRAAAVQNCRSAFRSRLAGSAWRVPQAALTSLRYRLNIVLDTWSFRHAAAHVNYIDDAVRIFTSYGVPPERIFITRNSPDTDLLLAVGERLAHDRASAGCARPRLLHVGRLIDWKRVDLLLSATARLAEKYPDVELLVVGDGPKAAEWKQMAEDLGIAGRTRFVGGVYDPVELGRLMINSAVYVLAGMGGLSINEAMCFGLPVVCAVGDGTEKHLVQDGVNGLYFANGDGADLYRKLDELLAAPARRGEMGRKSLEIIRNNINVHTVINRHLEAFEYVTGLKVGRSPPPVSPQP